MIAKVTHYDLLCSRLHAVRQRVCELLQGAQASRPLLRHPPPHQGPVHLLKVMYSVNHEHR